MSFTGEGIKWNGGVATAVPNSVYIFFKPKADVILLQESLKTIIDCCYSVNYGGYIVFPGSDISEVEAAKAILGADLQSHEDWYVLNTVDLYHIPSSH